MASPFPGMDPYVEGQRWKAFHGALIFEAQAWLVPRTRPSYVVTVEERVYVEHPFGERAELREPDLGVVKPVGSPQRSVARPPKRIESSVELPLPHAETHRERYLEVRLRNGGELVTAIEVLSPANKRFGSDGWREYLRKRNELLDTSVSLVELDLLRGGTRLPMGDEPPSADYYAYVSRGYRRPRANVWCAQLREPLPTVAVPLLEEEDDIPLPLQQLVDTVYRRGGYAYSLDYDHGTVPPLSAGDAEWAEQLILRWREDSSLADCTD